MKTLKDYLTESKKAYSFKVKVAGDIPENFQENLKNLLEKYKIVTLEKMKTSEDDNLQEFAEDDAAKDITVYDLTVEYPITAPEIGAYLKTMDISEESFRIRNSMSPTEYDQKIVEDEYGTLLDDPYYTKEAKVKVRDYFGDNFNKDFLKELAKEAKERRKELGIDKADPDVLGDAPKLKTDKAGVKSAIGS